MATIYAKNKITGEWDKVGPAVSATDVTLTLDGSPADAKATGDAVNNIQMRIANLTAEDVGALPSTTEIPSIEGLASITYVDEKILSVVGAAPDLLNTLDKLSAALGDDENFANTVTVELGKKANTANLGALAFKDSLTASDVNAASYSHTHNNATTSTAGLMSETDKTKLDSIPVATTDNNGQFLRVISGVPTWASIANAEEASF